MLDPTSLPHKQEIPCIIFAHYGCRPCFQNSFLTLMNCCSFHCSSQLFNHFKVWPYQPTKFLHCKKPFFPFMFFFYYICCMWINIFSWDIKAFLFNFDNSTDSNRTFPQNNSDLTGQRKYKRRSLTDCLNYSSAVFTCGISNCPSLEKCWLIPSVRLQLILATKGNKMKNNTPLYKLLSIYKAVLAYADIKILVDRGNRSGWHAD